MKDDPELERLMLDILTIAGTVHLEQYTQSSRRVRAFALRLLHERQAAIEAEREACAQACDTRARDVIGDWAGPRGYREAATEIAATIRARGKVD